MRGPEAGVERAARSSEGPIHGVGCCWCAGTEVCRWGGAPAEFIQGRFRESMGSRACLEHFRGFEKNGEGFCSSGELCYQERVKDSRGGQKRGRSLLRTGERAGMPECQAVLGRSLHSTCPPSPPSGGSHGGAPEPHRGSALGGGGQHMPQIAVGPPPSH